MLLEFHKSPKVGMKIQSVPVEKNFNKNSVFSRYTNEYQSAYFDIEIGAKYRYLREAQGIHKVRG